MSTWGGSYGSSGQFLTSQGSGSSWSWQDPHGVTVSIVTSNNSSWTLPTGAKACIVYCVGGGGSSGSAESNFDDTNRWGKSGGGGSGAIAWRTYSAAEFGTAANITIGGGGSAPNWSNGGNSGGTTTFNPNGSGPTLSAGGGSGSAAQNSWNSNGPGGSGGSTVSGHRGHWNGNTGINGGSNPNSQNGLGSRVYPNEDAKGSAFNDYGWGGRGRTGPAGGGAGDAGGSGAVYIWSY